MEKPFLFYDAHSGDPFVRCFRTPAAGVISVLPSVITESRSGDVVLRHYAWSDRWYALNVTFDFRGELTVTGPGPQYAVNCDITTPCIAVDGGVASLDLYLDVLIDIDLMTYRIVDRDDFDQAARSGVLRPDEVDGALRGLRELEELIRSGGVRELIRAIPPPDAAAPPAPPMERVPWTVLDRTPLLDRRARP